MLMSGLDPSLVTFVLDSLPAPPARVLEVGAGEGELARYLVGCGYDVVAIDPASSGRCVHAVPLHELNAAPASFDAAVAVVSLHHVQPLAESCRHLASLVRPEGTLVIDEFDIERLDLNAARWWLAQRPAIDHDRPTPEGIVSGLREHLHPLSRIRGLLEQWFEFSTTDRCPYLYRWQLRADFRAAEEREIELGRIPATGARVVGRRR